MKNREYEIINNSENISLTEIGLLFDEIFTDENVGNLGIVATQFMPGLEHKNWYLIKNNKLVSGLARVNWNVTFGDILLKVWEQAIVGTLTSERGQGLISKLNQKLDIDAQKEDVDLIIIQGIPGFYNKFGYRYSIEFETHINLSLDKIMDVLKPYKVRLATIEDFPLFKLREEQDKNRLLIQSHRDLNDWMYQLSNSSETEYSSKVYVFDEKYYVKIQDQGFGNGLIVSEISQNITSDKLDNILLFLKNDASKNSKPYIRFNLPTNSLIAKSILNRGAKIEGKYGWQVKILSYEKFLNKVKPVLENRLSNSNFNLFKGTFSLGINNKKLIIEIEDSKVNQIYWGDCECSLGINIPLDLVEPLFLGYKDWKTLNNCRPDLYVFSKDAGELLGILFPEENSWLYSIW
ncbi:MAG: GNAT family N-acetyltransferase [Spirochaetaceae bacterium]